MITKDAALDDLQKIEQEAVEAKLSTAVVIVRVAKVLVRVLATMRSNQLLTDAQKQAIQEAKKRKPEQKVQE